MNAKQIKAEVRRLRAKRRDWWTGRNLHWGQPWCPRRCANHPMCDGCATREYGRARAREIDQRIKTLLAEADPATDAHATAVAEREHPRSRLIGNLDSKLWRTAVHEAGHAVVGLATGSDFRSVTLRANKARGTLGSVAFRRAPSPFLAAVVIAAGGLAQNQTDPDYGDLAQEQEDGSLLLSSSVANMTHDIAALLRITEKHDVDMARVWQDAHTAVTVLRPLIEVVAAALMAPKPLRALSRAEVEAALQAAGRAPWVKANGRLGDAIGAEKADCSGWLGRYVAHGVGAAQGGAS